VTGLPARSIPETGEAPVSTRSFRYLRSLYLPLAALLIASSCGWLAAAELEDYVKAPDASFAWKQTSNHTTPVGTIHSINLVSQVWQGITWSHELTIYEPKELTHHDSALLFITGGGTGSKPSDKDHEMGFALTKVTGARVAVLHQVPKQPLLGDKTEDTLIAETFVRYLETKDKNWPLLFPMVKSATRAMDAGRPGRRTGPKARSRDSW